VKSLGSFLGREVRDHAWFDGDGGLLFSLEPDLTDNAEDQFRSS
jgi:hypothetical protein